MTEVEAPARAAKQLNHVEFVHRPGERQLVRALFDLLGLDMLEVYDGEYVIGVIDPATWDEASNENYIAGREVRAEQWAFDSALADALRQEPLAGPLATHEQVLADKPQDGMHFGIHFDTVARWEAVVARIEAYLATAKYERPSRHFDRLRIRSDCGRGVISPNYFTHISSSAIPINVMAGRMLFTTITIID